MFYSHVYFASLVPIVMNFVIKKYRPRHVLVVTLCSARKAEKQTCWHEELLYFLLVLFFDRYDRFEIDPSAFLESLSSSSLHAKRDLTWSDGRFSKASVPMFYNLQASTKL